MGWDGIDEGGVLPLAKASSMLLLFLFCSRFFLVSIPTFSPVQEWAGIGCGEWHDMAWHCIALHIADRESSGAISLFFSLHVKRFLHQPCLNGYLLLQIISNDWLVE